jgi:hypothetical protein
MTPSGEAPYALGRPGSRFEINTPGLILDLDALERKHCPNGGNNERVRPPP